MSSSNAKPYNSFPDRPSQSVPVGPTTPPRKPSEYSFKTTPRTDRVSAADKDVTATRGSMAESNGDEITECNLQTFLQHYLPNSRPSDKELDECTLKLLTGGSIDGKDTRPRLIKRKTETGHYYHWKPFSDRYMEMLETANENAFFRPLGEVAHEVARYVQDIRNSPKDVQSIGSSQSRGEECSAMVNEAAPNRNSPHHQLVLRPNQTNPSGIWGSSHKIDGYFRPAQSTASGKNSCVRDVALCLEFKKALTDKDVAENRRQLFSAANHVMNDDPRRMFTYGITIEKDQCTLWYFSRSHTAVSQSFNWLEDYRTFISVLIMFAFASPQELGYDPNVKFISSKGDGTGSWVYKLPVDETTSRYFRTLRSISEYRSLCITGRATRVWEVREVENIDGTDFIGDQTYVLKDVWLEEPAKTERQIQEKIIQDIGCFEKRIESGQEQPEFKRLPTAHRKRILDLLKEEAFRQYFLTVVTDCQGTTSKSVPVSASRDPAYLDDPPSSDSAPPADPESDLSRRRARSIQDHISTAIPPPPPQRVYVPKTQYRVVFKEICQAVHDLDRFPDVLTALRGALDMLLLLFAAGWVHRDVSSGNVLLYKPSIGCVRGILADLEYAKPFPSDEMPSADPKTGTPFFMPEEIITGEYLRKVVAENSEVLQDDSESDNDDDGLDKIRKKSAKNATLKRLPAIQHNFVHDLESLWWLFVWILIARVELPDRNHELISGLFTNRLKNRSHHRREALTDPTYLCEELKQWLPPALHLLAEAVDVARSEIMKVYVHVNIPTIRNASNESYFKYKQLVSKVYKYLYALLSASEQIGQTLAVVPLSQALTDEDFASTEATGESSTAEKPTSTDPTTTVADSSKKRRNDLEEIPLRRKMLRRDEA